MIKYFYVVFDTVYFRLLHAGVIYAFRFLYSTKIMSLDKNMCKNCFSCQNDINHFQKKIYKLTRRTTRKWNLTLACLVTPLMHLLISYTTFLLCYRNCNFKICDAKHSRSRYKGSYINDIRQGSTKKFNILITTFKSLKRQMQRARLFYNIIMGYPIWCLFYPIHPPYHNKIRMRRSKRSFS